MRAPAISQFFLAAIIVFAATSALVGQESGQQDGQWPRNGFPPASRLKTQQGYTSQADVIASRRVTQGTRIRCLQVEHNLSRDTNGAGAACVLTFDRGETRTLHFGEVMKSPKDGQVSLN
ncbi:MAG TPA: hypothetical protein VIW68_07785 [Candidatus Sulfotelmatobacter sp.]